jgi:hypothetical protein
VHHDRYRASPAAGHPVSPFEPVRTKADLDTLDEREIAAGYVSTERGDPEPGPNRGRAFWHGWRNRTMWRGPLEELRAELAELEKMPPRYELFNWSA